MTISFSRRTLLAAASSLAIAGAAMAAEPLALQVYNAGAEAVFPVSSVLVTGAREAVLIDAQFQRNDAQALVSRIRASGKRLTTIYVSHSDPDYYFGLDVLRAAFPQARIVATPETVAAIAASMEGKRAHWGPILKGNAPAQLVLPQVLRERQLSVDGQALEIRGPQPARSFVWIPSLRAVVGGIPVAANIHVWMADTQTPASRREWLQTLDAIAALQPATVVPGHYLPGAGGQAPQGLESVAFTRAYVEAFEQEAAAAPDSAALIAAMRKRFPTLGELSSLELSARVAKGEMRWPQ
ncbi:MBL fold metallo-hydrolase [Pseudorhodoferax sp. Leaf274]|uniref:MBL fold metallo-hydrolase n=1 Tax=Pseudorhodoferax sp. Leaf274 TaxID=1736318 RepID=UPI0007037BA2|nr:MBL fold metallo-hydrolase [Pseudorhodoferax sp. Leaf274]KQP37331.1 MBL fold metallo-hydrolase [Pseudorhodoferax sp. Leaf274]